jgi:hypothetical protein
VWRRELQRFADWAGLVVEVCHFPLGTRRWSRIEYTLGSTIFRSSPGEPRLSDTTLLHLIGPARAPADEGARLEKPSAGAVVASSAASAPPRAEDPAARGLGDEWSYTIEPRP